MKTVLLLMGALLLVYWGWQMSMGSSRGLMFDGPARYVVPLAGLFLLVLGLMI